MTVVLAICVAVVFTVSIFMILGQELKGIAIGVFLIGHAANLCIIAMSGSPVLPNKHTLELKEPPLLQFVAKEGPSAQGERGATSDQMPSPTSAHHREPSATAATAPTQKEALLNEMVDPLPQALILTAIVIGFGTMGFLLSLIVVTARSTHTLDVGDLAKEQRPTPSREH